MKVSRSSVVTNFIWRFLERCGAQGVTFVVSIVLARLLDPAAYGVLALVTVFTTILQVFVDSGFGNALIQKKDADDLDFSTVFYYNIAMCSLLYIGMFFAAPYIARFYNMPQLTSVVRVVSLMLIISGVKDVQQAYVSRNMMFKKFFFATLGGTIGAAVIGIIMAYRGFGLWALVAQMLFNMLVDTIILWVTVKWRPKLMFSFERLKGLFSYGWKLLVSSLINTIYQRIRSLIIGKRYSSADLGYYNKGNHFPSFVSDNVNSAIQSVLFPAMAQSQDEKSNVKAMTRRSIKISSYLMIPAMAGLAMIGEPLIKFLLTEKWLFTVPYLRISCFTHALIPMHTANLQAIKAMGKSDVFLKLEIIKKVVGITAIVISIPYGVFAIAFSGIINSVLSSVINASPNKKLLDYGYFEQLKDFLPAVLCSFVMCLVVWLVGLLNINYILLMFIQIVIGAIVYFSLSTIFKLDSFTYILAILKALFSKKRGGLSHD